MIASLRTISEAKILLSLVPNGDNIMKLILSFKGALHIMSSGVSMISHCKPLQNYHVNKIVIVT